jgi:hypothetical protein
VRSFTILTTTPNEVCAPIHDRMPVILDRANYGRWLGEEPVDPVRLLMMLKPYAAEAMTAYPIGPRVGNVKDAGTTPVHLTRARERHSPMTTQRYTAIETTRLLAVYDAPTRAGGKASEGCQAASAAYGARWASARRRGNAAA